MVVQRPSHGLVLRGRGKVYAKQKILTVAPKHKGKCERSRARKIWIVALEEMRRVKYADCGNFANCLCDEKTIQQSAPRGLAERRFRPLVPTTEIFSLPGRFDLQEAAIFYPAFRARR